VITHFPGLCWTGYHVRIYLKAVIADWNKKEDHDSMSRHLLQQSNQTSK
jgi:hypothetical protein